MTVSRATTFTAVLWLAFAMLAGCRKPVSERELSVAAASDLARAMPELASAYEKKTGVHVSTTFGASGLLARQIAEGAPFDAFFSADSSYVDASIANGHLRAASQLAYARGELVMWCANPPAPKSLEELAGRRFVKIAIANPEHAPYGKAAKSALEKSGVWPSIATRMVYGENVQQTLALARSGNADVAIVARSLAVDTGGAWTAIDPSQYIPLRQTAALTTRTPRPAVAQGFLSFVASEEGRSILARHGFSVPTEAKATP